MRSLLALIALPALLAAAPTQAADTPLATAVETARAQGAADQTRARKRTLKKATRLAKKAGDRRAAKNIKRVIKADAALGKLERLVARAEAQPGKRGKKARRKALKKGKRHARILKKALSAYRALEDEPQQARARVLLLRYDALRQSAEKTLRASTKLLRVGDRSEETRNARIEVRRLRSQVMAELGRWSDAAHEALTADRIATDKSDAYRRSRMSARVCREALKHGVECDRLEEDTMGARTFYDFSQEKKRSFSVTRAAAVRTEYEGLIKGCLVTSEDLGELDREASFEWRVDNDGQVREFVSHPRFLQHGELGECLDDAFAKMRYPRFRGESPTIELTYDLDLRG